MREKSIERARKFKAYFNKNVESVKEKTAEIGAKKRVLVLNYNSGNFNTVSPKDIDAEYISVAGGINLSSKPSKEEFKISKAMNEKQVTIFIRTSSLRTLAKAPMRSLKTRRLPS